MEEDPSSNPSRRFSLVSGVLIAGIASSVLIAWFIGYLPLIFIRPDFAPMQFNTALGFFLLGLGLCSLDRAPKWVPFAMGIAVFWFALAVILQYILEVDFGIDQFFFQADQILPGLFPGRPAPNTAIAFLVSSVILCGLARGDKKWDYFLSFYLAHALAALALAALMGYFFGLQSIYGWGHFTRMALLSALSFLLLAAGIIGRMWGVRSSLKMAGTFLILGILLSMTVLQILASTEERDVRTHFNHDTTSHVLSLQRQFDLTVRTLSAFAGFFEGSQQVTADEYAHFASKLGINSIGLQSLEWVPLIKGEERVQFEAALCHLDPDSCRVKEELEADGSFRAAGDKDSYFPIHYVEPFQVNRNALGFDHSSLSERRETMEQALRSSQPRMTGPIRLLRRIVFGEKGFLIFHPVYASPEGPKDTSNLRGFLVAAIRIPVFYGKAFQIFSDQLAYRIVDITDPGNPSLILEPSLPPHLYSKRFNTNSVIEILGRRHRLEFYASHAYLHKFDSYFPWLSFLMVFMLAIILTIFLRREIEAREILNRQKEHLERTNQDLDKFTHIVSHELRNPLTILKEPLVQVLNGNLGDTNEKQKKFLGIVLRGIQRLLNTTTSLLDLSKMERGKDPVVKKPFDLSALIRGVAEPFQLAAEAQGLKLTFKLPESCEVHADEAKISRVLTNLLTNAFKYTKKGHVELALQVLGDQVEVRVNDTGPGISPDFAPRLFSKFEQFKGEEGSTRDVGTGLGLALSKEIVEAHGGEIGVESEFGRGSSFYFRLPLH